MRFFPFLLLFPAFAFSQAYLLKNVTVIPMSQETRPENYNVFIKNGRIEKMEAVSSKLKPEQKDRTVIDGSGKYLMPGLADMHAHFPGKNAPIDLQTYLKLSLAAGVTTIRSMRGKETELALRDSVDKNLKKAAPHILVSYVFPYRDTLLTKDSIDKIVNAAKAKHYDFIKYLGGIGETNFKYLADACASVGMPLAGHAYKGSLQKSIDAGFASVEHYQPLLDAYLADSLGFDKTLEAMKAKQVAFCPTLSFYYIYADNYSSEELMKRNGMEHVSPAVTTDWKKEQEENLDYPKKTFKGDYAIRHKEKYRRQLSLFNRVLKKAVDAGVLVLLSPDESVFNVPGFSMYEEMTLYKNAGLSNYQVLKCASYNAAVYFKQQSQWGSVETGKRADLLLLNGDPLKDLSNIKRVEGTFINGTYYTQKELLK